jgi:O-antigen ligase
MPESPSPVRASAWEWARTALLSVDIAWTTLCLGGFMPGTRVVMIALTALTLAAYFCDPLRPRSAHPAGWLFVPFIAYAACSAAWVTPVHWMGWTDWINWAQMIGVFWVVLNGVRSEGPRRFLCLVLVALGVTTAALALYQHYIDPRWLMLGRRQLDQYIGRATGSFGIPNSQGVFLALLLPPVAAIAFGRGRPTAQRLAASAVLAALGCAFVLAISRGAWLALAAAIVLRSLFSPGKSFGKRIAGAAAVVAAGAAALALLYFSYPLMHERMQQFVTDAGERTRPIVWRGAWGIFREHPVLGGGAGCFDVLFEAFRPIGFRDDPVYAHCDYLNTLCDYGIVGFILFFGPAAIVMGRCAGARGFRGAVFTGLLAFALHLLVDFHLKLPALAMIVAAVSALLAAEEWPAVSEGAPPGGEQRAGGIALSALILFGAFAWAVPKFQADRTRLAAREGIDRMAKTGVDASTKGDALAAIRAELRRAAAMDPTNAQSWSDLAYADTLWALVEPSQTRALGVEAEADAGRAVALSQVVAEFWVRKGEALDMQQRWVEGGESSSKSLNLAPSRADIWFYHAYHLSLKDTETGPALAAANMSLRLDPGFLLAQLLRQRLADR